MRFLTLATQHQALNLPSHRGPCCTDFLPLFIKSKIHIWVSLTVFYLFHASWATLLWDLSKAVCSLSRTHFWITSHQIHCPLVWIPNTCCSNFSPDTHLMLPYTGFDILCFLSATLFSLSKGNEVLHSELTWRFFFTLNVFYLLFILMHQLCFGLYFHSLPFLLATALKWSVSAFQRCEWIWQKMRKEGKRREINHNPPSLVYQHHHQHTHTHTQIHTHIIQAARYLLK